MKFNPKRRIATVGSDLRSKLCGLANKVVYSGNPEHKKSPGDFGLDPPACAHRAKTLCDNADIYSRKVATNLIREGLKRGAVSRNFVDGWPKQVWAVDGKGTVLEAQRDRPGSYHGYPLAPGDPFRDLVIKFWNRSDV